MTDKVNARLATNASEIEVLDVLSNHLTRLNGAPAIEGNTIRASNLRKDKNDTVDSEITVVVQLTRTEDGWLLDGSLDSKYKANWVTVLLVVGVIGGLISANLIFVLIGIAGIAASTVRASNRAKAAKKDLSECFELTRNQLASPVQTQSPKAEYRKCPMCAEQVRIEAVKCRFCSSDLPSIGNAH